MTRGVVIVVGPATVCGPCAVDPERARAAIGCIDDEMGLVSGVIRDADAIWRDVVADAAGSESGRLTVICPQHWSGRRIERVRRAAAGVGAVVEIADRREALRQLMVRPRCPVIEVGEDLAVIARPGEPTIIHHRWRAAPATLAGSLGDTPEVIIDVPDGVVGARQWAEEVSAVLAGRGIDVHILGCADLYRGNDAPERRKRWPTRVLTAAASAVALMLMALATGATPDPAPAVAPPNRELTWLVEGRASIQVPAAWTVDRVVADSGSARMQVISPDGPTRIIHLTQASVPREADLAASARVLRAAAATAGPGVIVDFEDAATVAGRAAVTYREVRPGREVRWSVLLDGGLRIAIGCQGAEIAAVCDQAIRSAHRIDEKLLAGNGTERPSGASNQQDPTKGTS